MEEGTGAPAGGSEAGVKGTSAHWCPMNGRMRPLTGGRGERHECPLVPPVNWGTRVLSIIEGMNNIGDAIVRQKGEFAAGMESNGSKEKFMSKETFEIASESLWDKLEKDNVPRIMKYAPFSDSYWSASPRIVLCNYENIAYLGREPTTLMFPTLKRWIEYNRSHTVRYTAVFANALYETLHRRSGYFDISEMRKSYHDIDMIHKSMENMMFMNLRPTGTREKTEPHGSLVNEYKYELKAFIEALDADIFIVSTKGLVDFLNDIFADAARPLRYKEQRKMGKILVFSVPSFASTPRHFHYRYYCDRAREIADTWRYNRNLDRPVRHKKNIPDPF
jgi:hypothetical protein